MASKTWHTVEFSRNRHTPLTTDQLVDPSSGAAVLLYSPARPHSTSGRCDSCLRVPHPPRAAQAAARHGLGLSFRDRPPGRWPSVSVPPWQRGETLRGSRALVKRPATGPSQDVEMFCDLRFRTAGRAPEGASGAKP